MSSHTTLYEIAQAMQSRETLQNDINDIMTTVKNVLYDKYIGRLNSVIQEHHTRFQNEPPKEIRLLEAVKPFIDTNSHSTLDQIINVMYMANTAKSLQGELLSTASAKPEEKKNVRMLRDLVKPDGVYETDATCMNSRAKSSSDNASASFGDSQNILLIFLLLLIVFNVH